MLAQALDESVGILLFIQTFLQCFNYRVCYGETRFTNSAVLKAENDNQASLLGVTIIN